MIEAVSIGRGSSSLTDALLGCLGIVVPGRSGLRNGGVSRADMT
jgi:hypothetical protein